MVDAVNTFPILPEGVLPYVVRTSKIMSFFWKELEFYPKGEFKYTATRNSLIQLGLNNLCVEFGTGATAHLKIANSLHKVYHEGRNDNDFTKSELDQTIEFLETIFGTCADSFKFKSDFEFSVNIGVNSASRIIEQLVRFKNKAARPMEKKNKEFGKKFYSDKFNFKVYNPILKLKLEIPLNNLQDLRNNNVLSMLGERLRKQTQRTA